MKAWYLWIIAAVWLVTCSFSIYADQLNLDIRYFDSQRWRHHNEGEDARYIIRRTARVLFAARQAVEHRHYYWGYARAFGNQQRARELYEGGFYQEAIFHSLRARELALVIIRKNRGRIQPQFYNEATEKYYERISPRGDGLDRRLDMRRIGRDKDAVRLKFALDIN